MEGHGGAADALEIAVDTEHVTDVNREVEGHGVDRHGGHAALGPLAGGDASRDVHLGQHPAAEDVAARVGIGRHGQGSGRQLAARFLVV